MADTNIIEPYLELWDLKLDGKPFTSEHNKVVPVIYKNEPAVLKLLMPKSHEENSPKFLKYHDGQACVKLLAEHNNAIVMERAENDILLDQIDDDKATEILAEVILNLHGPRHGILPEGLNTIEDNARCLFEKAKNSPNTMYSQAAELFRELLSEKKPTYFLHGDIHHFNVAHSSRGWLAIDPASLIGELAYETANCLRNPFTKPQIAHDKKRILRQADILSERLNLDKKRILAYGFIHSCLSVAWEIEDGNSIEYSETCAKLMKELI